MEDGQSVDIGVLAGLRKLSLNGLLALSVAGVTGVEDKHIDDQKADELRWKYPNHMPLEIAGQHLGVSERWLSGLIAEGRMPFALFSANIGSNKQRYCHVYTERLIAYSSPFKGK